MRIDIDHPTAGTVPQVANPIRLADAALCYDRPPPLLGQHSLEILRELGLDDAEIAELRNAEII
jgi:crotonobetainyl-CoA:carnitine CoA-transferase CaiB-like acyl-CoA transferase